MGTTLRLSRFFACVILAQSAVLVALRLIPRPLSHPPDLVGYPVFANFNIDLLFRWYFLQVILFPILVLALHVAMGGEKEDDTIPSPSVSLTSGPAWLFHFVIPLAVFVLHAGYPILDRFELFHDGEHLVPSLLFAKGYVPWRDLLFTHGLLEDGLKSWLGHRLFGETFFGAASGVSLVWKPLCWTLQYFLLLALSGKNRPWVAVFSLVLPFAVPGVFDHYHFRFILQPLVLLALLRLFTTPSRRWAVLFVALGFAQAVVTPESAYTILAVGVTVLARDYFAKDWRCTRWCLISGGVLGVAWLTWLGFVGALGDFVDYYRTFAPNHRYTGGIPFPEWPLAYSVPLYLPLALVMLSLFVMCRQLWRRRELTPVEWVAFAMMIFSALYYQKFLSRADAHIFSVLAMAYPLLFWIVGRGLGQLPVRANAIALTSLAIVLAPRWLPHYLGTPARLTPPVVEAGVYPRLGGFPIGKAAAEGIEEWKGFLARHLNESDRIFDFSNAPALYFYLLDRRPSTRFFHVSMAIRRPAQQRLIQELERERPKLVVFHGASDLARWDGISNMVRHWEVSEYLLRHYRPVDSPKGFTALLRNDLVRKPKVESYFAMESCDWGYVPHFSSVPLAAGSSLPFETREGATIVQVPPDFQKARYLEVDFAVLNPALFAIVDTHRNAIDRRNLISFKSLPATGMRYRIPVASCAQWYGFQGGKLLLAHTSPQKIAAVRLVE